MAAKYQQTVTKEGENDSSPFHRNLLISFDYGQLRQVLVKLVVRLLTEGLLVRI